MAKAKMARHKQASGRTPKKPKLAAAPDGDLEEDNQTFLGDSDDEAQAAADLEPDQPAETPAEARLRMGRLRCSAL